MTGAGPYRRLRLGTHESAQIYSTIRTAIRTVGVVVIFYFLFQCVGEFAGTSTDLAVAGSFVLAALINLKFAFAIALTGLACAWGAVERYLRQRQINQFSSRIRELETTIDPNRSSSQLTPWGGTNPQDRMR